MQIDRLFRNDWAAYRIWVVWRLRIVLACLFLCALGTAYANSSTVRTEQAQVELVAHAPQGLTPGAPAWLGIVIEHKPDWHTYWKNPGDSGLPTELQWQLPQGLTAGSILWPLPKKIPIPPLANFGFEGRTLLAVPLQVGTDFKPDIFSGKVKIGLQATWLICRRECIPQSGTFSLELPAGASTVRDGALFEALLKEQPRRVKGQQHAEVVLLPSSKAKELPYLRVNVQGLPASWRGKKLEAFPETTGIFETAGTAGDAPQRWENNFWTVDLPISPYRQASPKSIPILLIHRAAGTGLVVQASIKQGWTPQKSSPPSAEPANSQSNGTLQAATGSSTSTAIENDKENASTTDTETITVSSDPSQLDKLPSTTAPSTVSPSPSTDQAEPAVEQITNNSSLASGLLLSLVAAFLGGLLLNLMPCVFPVLSIKILSFAQAPSPSTTQGLKSASHLTGGLLYGLGVVLSFALLAVLLLALRAAGQALGWGFQLQSPWVIGALMAFFVAIALNLLGVFELKSFLPSGVAAWRAQNPNVDHFLSGVLAVLVASPCTAPFMGAALGAALTYPTWAALSVFIALGLGMALPYVLLAAFPAWLRFLPKPGAWMLRFKQWMALPMLLTVAWLAWVLYQQLVPPKVTQSPVLTHAVAGEWQPWSLERERTLLEAKEIVFVDYTAAWCITCQVNKRTTLDANEVKAKFKEKKVNLLQADWTRYDPAITESLRKLGRSGIPVYVLYAPGKSPKLFTEFLSKESLLEELNRL